MSRGVRRTLLILAVFVLAAGALELLITLSSQTQTSPSWKSQEIVMIAQNRLRAIARQLDSGLTRVEHDVRIIKGMSASDPQQEVFGFLAQDNEMWNARLPDSLRWYGALDRRDTAERGCALYSNSGKLEAWSSATISSLEFDTVIPQSLVSDRYIETIRLQKGFFHSYVTAARRLTGPAGIVGHAIAKRLLGSEELIGSSEATHTTFLDDLKEPSKRDFQIVFGAVRKDSTFDGTQEMLYADPNDHASAIGVLQISKAPIVEPTPIIHALQLIRAIASILFLLILLGWGLGLVRDLRIQKHPVRARLGYSVFVVLSLVLIRLVFVALDNFGFVFGQSIQDSSVFASDWGYGLVKNPLELFVTTLMTSLVAVFLWIVWIPRKRIIRDDSHRRSIDQLVRKRVVRFVVFSLLAIACSAVLTDALSALIESVVVNGTVQYLVIRQVLPSPSIFVMYLSFLSIGVTYLFIASLLLIFSLRAIVFVLPRDLPFLRRVALGSLIFIALVLIASEVMGFVALTTTTSLYRIGLALVVGLTTIGMVLSDILVSRPLQHSPSFLFRLPRSSRSILFILAFGAAIVSPLIAEKELLKDREVAQGIVSQNAESDASYLSTVIQQSLADARQNIQSWTEGSSDAVRQSAFLIWVTNLRAHPDWQAVIEVTDGTGHVVSHFGTTAVRDQLQALRNPIDSVRRLLARLAPSSDTSAQAQLPVATHIVAAFGDITSSLILGAARLPIKTEPAGIHGPLTITMAIWSELPALQTDRAPLDLGRPGGEDVAGSSQVIANGEFIVAEYVGASRHRTNVPTLDVPARLPEYILYRARREFNFWERSSIDGNDYQTLYHRLPYTTQSRSNAPTLIAVSVPEPTVARAVEFGLRLNAIGLIYGVALALLFVLVRQFGTRKIQLTLKFRDRIFLIVLAIAMLPLIIVTNVTRNLLREPAQNEERDRLARDAAVIRDRIGRQMELGVANIYGLGLQQDVADLAQTLGRNFTVFDSHGLLVASSRPEYYESTMLPNHLSSTAMEQVVLGQQTFFTEPLVLGSQRYQIGYQPVTNHVGASLIGVISVATLGERSNIDAEVARTTSLIYGTFAALGLILLAIGAIFAARVASPILSLIFATERVAQGKLRTSLPVTRQDEIGELMQAFNTMTSELEKSRQIVAQTEREVAWKEMARQVAHEIKNPLTPMKLSVQHLEHAHEAKDPNFTSIFRRVIGTLSEQIDVLTRIATEFARFGEMPRRKYAVVSVRKIAERAVALFDADRSHIRFVIDIPPATPYINVDEEEFRRALVNLIRNAIQATDGWGVIAIRTSYDREMVHIRLSDTGSGMDEETVMKAFDPNFSTKTSGMGLGLAIVKKTVNDMGGIIAVESKLGKGTSFMIDLPARERPDKEAV